MVNQDNEKALRFRFRDFVYGLQNSLCASFEALDGAGRFREDLWERDEGGGGRSRVLEKGDLIEKGGVNVSEVYGPLPEPIRQKFEVEQGWFFATGISLIIHPWSPMIPTVHANYRYFELYDSPDREHAVDCWFGGGADLSPYYLWEEDVKHFHQTQKQACDTHGKELYPKFKKECDDYFYNAHRGEARGVGGIFYDYLRPDESRSAEDWFAFSKSVGQAFLPSYKPIVEARAGEPYHENHRYFQEIRRGRYVEFNLIHDRGTLFGLKSGGRSESILVSMPPRVRWDYQYKVQQNSAEQKLLDILKEPRDWA